MSMKARFGFPLEPSIPIIRHRQIGRVPKKYAFEISAKTGRKALRFFHCCQPKRPLTAVNTQAPAIRFQRFADARIGAINVRQRYRPGDCDGKGRESHGKRSMNYRSQAPCRGHAPLPRENALGGGEGALLRGQLLRSEGGTASVSHSLSPMIFSATLPRKSFFAPLRPRVPTTIRSAEIWAASVAMVAATEPCSATI